MNDRIAKEEVKIGDLLREMKDESKVILEKLISSEDAEYRVTNKYCGCFVFDDKHKIEILPPKAPYKADVFFMFNKYKNKYKKEELYNRENREYELPEECHDKLFNIATLFELYARYTIEELCEGSNFKMINKDKKTYDKNLDGVRNPVLKDDKGIYLRGDLIPDIVLVNKASDKDYKVLDAKFKDKTTYNIGTRDDRLQLLAYSLMWNSKNIGHIFPSSEFLIESSRLKNKGSIKGRYFEIEIPVQFYEPYKITKDFKKKFVNEFIEDTH